MILAPRFERFEFVDDYRGPMARLTWMDFDVMLCDWPGSLIQMLEAGVLGPVAGEEAATLRAAVEEDW